MEQGVKIPKIAIRTDTKETRYCINVPARYSRTGERHQIFAYSEEEVKKLFLKEAHDVLEHNEMAELADSITVSETVKKYLDYISPSGDHTGKVKATTAEKYTRCYLNHIDGAEFGEMKLCRVKLYHCEDFIQSLYDKKITKEYVSQIKSLISMSFDFAVGRDFMVKNYMRPVRINPLLCSGQKHETGVWEDSEIKALWDGSVKQWREHRRYRYSAVFMALIFTGCRIGELSAATWEDVDFKVGTLRINKTMTRYTDYITHTKIREATSTKTPESARTVRLTDSAIIWLNEIRRRNVQIGYTGPHIVVSRKGRVPKEEQLLASFKRFCECIGVQYKASHTCRRTYATMMIDGHIPITQVSKDLGHKKLSTTQNTYYKCRDEEDEIMDRKNSIIKEAFGDGLASLCQDTDIADISTGSSDSTEKSASICITPETSPINVKTP